MPNQNRPGTPFFFFLGFAFSPVFFASGCGQGDGQGIDTVSVRDSAGVTIVENHPNPDLPICSLSPTPEVTIGVTDGPDVYELYRVFDATRLSNGDLAVVNQGSSEIRIFDEDGVFLRAFGGRGEGPGEFRDVFQIWSLPGDTLWVGDYRPWRFLVFAPNGEWIRTIQPDPIYINSPREMGLLANGHSILGNAERSYDGPGFRPEELHLVLHGEDGQLLDSLGVYPHGRWGQTTETANAMWVYPFFEPFTRVAVDEDRYAVSTAKEAEIRVFNPEAELVRIIRWDAGDRTVRGSDIQAEKDRIIGQYPDMDPADRRRLVEPLVNDARPSADRFPALAGLRYGRTGTLWVREYPRPAESESDGWLAFDSQGRMLCRGEFPKRLSIFELGPDYLLGEVRDELGVERVVRYGLRLAGES